MTVIKNKISIPVFFTVAAIAAASLYYFFNPATAGFFPSCPFRFFTGYLCPGCGSQRALHELLHLNVSGAFKHNPMLVIAIPYVALALIFSLPQMKQNFPETRNFLFGYKAVIAILIILIIYAVFRNL